MCKCSSIFFNLKYDQLISVSMTCKFKIDDVNVNYIYARDKYVSPNHICV